MALDEVSAHTSGGADGALEIESVMVLQAAEIGAAEGLGRDADGELGGRERCDGQTCTVNADAIALMGVIKDLGAFGDCEGRAALGGRDKAGDGWLLSQVGY